MKNKYKIISNLMLYLSVILVAIMIVHSLIDYQDYLQHPEYSAPFSVNLIFKSIIYGIPVVVGLVLSHILKNKIIKQ